VTFPPPDPVTTPVPPPPPPDPTSAHLPPWAILTILVATVVLTVTATLIAPALYRMRRGRRTSAALPDPDTEQAETLR